MMNKKILSLISACALAITSFASVVAHADYTKPEFTLVSNFEAVGLNLTAANRNDYLDNAADLAKYMNAPLYKATLTFEGAQAEDFLWNEDGTDFIYNDQGDFIMIGCPVDMIQTSFIMSSDASLAVIGTRGIAGATIGTNINNPNELTFMWSTTSSTEMIGTDTLVATWYIVDTTKKAVDTEAVTLEFNMESDQKVQINKLYDGTGSSAVDTYVPVVGDELNFVNYPVVEEAQKYAVTVNGEKIGTYEAGEEVTVTANIPEGKVIDSITASVDYTDNENGTYTFTMPAGEVTFTIEYVAAPPADLSVGIANGTTYYTDGGKFVETFNCTATGAAKSNTWKFVFAKGTDERPFYVDNMPTVNGGAPLEFQAWIVSAEGGISLASVDDVE